MAPAAVVLPRTVCRRPQWSARSRATPFSKLPSGRCEGRGGAVKAMRLSGTNGVTEEKLGTGQPVCRGIRGSEPAVARA